jgi:glycosyltransferase involved in cell wall biosynthesis
MENVHNARTVPKITAILYANSDAAHLARSLESLRPCDEVLVIDYKSDDHTREIARAYGATVKDAIPGVDEGAYVIDAGHDWILCLLPSEVLSQELQAALEEWKQRDHGASAGFSLKVRREGNKGWEQGGTEMRLFNRTKINFKEALPPNIESPRLPGELLRFKN